MYDLYLKELRLINYCSYDDYKINFCKPDGTPYRYVCFFGPNGIGKSTLLEAISLLTVNNHGRTDKCVKESLFKFVRNKNYDPLWSRLDPGMKLENMMIQGTFVMNGREYIVQLTQDGFVRNDLAPIAPPDADEEDIPRIQNGGPFGKLHLLFRQRISHFFKTDSDLSMSKFQLHISQAENFEKIISQIMRYKADCISPSGLTAEERQYCTDFVIHKRGHQIHYKRMSAGERKICKSFSSLLNMMYDLANPEPGEIAMPGWPRLLLIDNVEMHVYYDRHVQLVESLKEVFRNQQIFATTHSGVLVQRYLKGENDQKNELYIDLEPING